LVNEIKLFIYMCDLNNQKIHKLRHHSSNGNRLKNATKQTSTLETKSQISSSSSLFRNYVRSNHLKNSDTNVPAVTTKSSSNDFRQLNNLLGLANVALEIRDTLKND
jgi:hypothetical protein